MANHSNETEVALSDPLKVMEAPRYSEFHRTVRVFFGRKLAVFGLVIIVLLVLMAIFAPLIATHDPYSTDVRNKLQPPSTEHWLGTDAVGRDTFSRIVYGARTSLIVGIVSVSSSAVIGMTRYCCRVFQRLGFNVIMRFIDVLMAIRAWSLPSLLPVWSAEVSPLSLLPYYWQHRPQCRIMCGQVLSVKENEYILAGRVIGVNNLRLMFGISSPMPSSSAGGSHHAVGHCHPG